MKSLTAFSQVLLQELGQRCGTSTVRDCKTITDRVEHEGLSFLTISLPSFGRSFEEALSSQKVDRSLFQGFTWKGGLPRFLGGFLDQVFDRGTGLLLDVPSIEAIRAVRQITLAFGKVNVACSDERTASAKMGYIKCEQELHSRNPDDWPKGQFSRIARMLWSDIFTSMDLAIYEGDLLPKHGPGATADRLRGNAKWNQTEWTRRLEHYFPMGEFVFPSWSHFLATPVKYLEPGAERPVRVITVPKTLKTPRIIAIEPTCMQYVQQSILERFSQELPRHHYASSFISLDDQGPNRDLAREGSISGSLATLDLSEASDRVSNQHVLVLTADHPHLRDGVQACRTTKADLDGEIISLSKFASMGSALCFPFEALVFTTIVFCGIEDVLSRRLTHKDIQSLVGQVRVYGDDIIVPVEYVQSVIMSLASFGMKVNMHKSFWTGKFRESCGGDYYDGQDVTPVRVRRPFPSSLTDVDECVSTVALRNNLFEAGFSECVDWLDAWMDRVLPVYPKIERHTQGLGRWTWEPVMGTRHHRSLHIPMVKVCVVEAKLPESKLEGYGALTKWFLKRGDLPFEDENHLLRAGRPVSVRIKTRWVPLR